MRCEVREFLHRANVDEMDAELMVLALDEACTNVIRYAYRGDPSRTIRLNLEVTGDELHCTIRDYGASCDPEKIRGRELDDFRPGGLGVRIMRTAFDRVEYIPKPRGTCLKLTKFLRRKAKTGATR